MPEFHFTSDEAVTLLKISRNTLKSLFHPVESNNMEFELTTGLKQPYGVFVSLYNHSKLRGCIGSFSTSNPLYESVQDLTRAAALTDSRFKPVTSEEVDQIEIELSVLSPLEKIVNIDDFKLGQHGIYMKSGYQSGTFLPQVAHKTKWTKEEFLGHCSRDKAGLGWSGWRDAELFRYEAFIIKESEY